MMKEVPNTPVALRPADSADHILENAKGVYKEVLILGWDKEHCLDVRSTTQMRATDLLFIVEKFKTKLLNGDYSED